MNTRWLQTVGLASAAIAFGLVATAETQSSATDGETRITIKPSVAWNVTGRDDLAQLKRLAGGIGWEFEPNADTTAGLKTLGMKTIRCINVDPLPGQFAKGQALDAQTTALQELDNGTFAITDGQVDIGFAAPPSSVSLVVIAAE